MIKEELKHDGFIFNDEGKLALVEKKDEKGGIIMYRNEFNNTGDLLVNKDNK